MNRSVRILLKKELLELRADRKAVILGVFLPVLLYPLLFFVTSSLQQRQEAAQQASRSRIVLLGDALRLEDRLGGDEDFDLTTLPPGKEPSPALAAGEVDAVVEGVEDPRTFRILYRRTRKSSRLARQRVLERLEELQDALRQERWRERGGQGELDSLLVLEEIDVATATEAGGARAGRRLVYLLLMTLFVSGAALANDLVAGEKERGTLETLYLLPVPRRDIALAKILVVVGGTTLSGVLSLLSIAGCFAAGWIESAAGASTTLSLPLLGAAALLVVPLALFLGGLLLGISTFARSLKEAQQLVLPVMLLAFGAGILSMSQAVRLDSMVALIPVANVALAIRDLLAGQVHPVSIAVVSLSSFAWGALTLRWVTVQLQREEMVLGFDPEPFLAPTAGGRRRATLLALALSVLAYFYLGSLLQTKWREWGVLLSLWGLLPLFGALTLWWTRPEGPLRELLSWRRPRGRALAAAPLLAWGLMLPMMGGWMRLQAHWLPAPQSLSRELEGIFAGLATWKIFFLGAVSPAVCEELLFRGVFLGRLRRVGNDRWAIVVTALFFGLTHLSIYRFVPTAVLGLLLGLLVVRGASIVPAMLFHLLYNGTLLLGPLWLEHHAPPLPLDGVAAWALSLLLLGGGLWLLGGAPASSRFVEGSRGP